MRVVHKYPFKVKDLFSLDLPIGAEILAVQEQHGGLCLWALVDPREEMETRNFRLAGTGHSIDEKPDTLLYIGTTQVASGALVWHVFEVVE